MFLLWLVQDHVSSDKKLSGIPGTLHWQERGLEVMLAGADGFLGMMQSTSGPSLAIRKGVLQGAASGRSGTALKQNTI